MLPWHIPEESPWLFPQAWVGTGKEVEEINFFLKGAGN
jgi:hypothetical protein